MFRRHLSGATVWPFAAVGGVCGDSVDAGSGGGTPAGGAAVADRAGDPPVSADRDADDGADSGADDPAAHPASAGDDDADPFSADDDDVAQTLPEATLRTRHRRTQRALAKIRPLADRLRDSSGKFLTPQEVDRILASDRDFRDIDSVLSRSPEAVQFLMRERQRLQALDRGERPPGDPDPADQPFNDEDWEFETDTPQGKRLLAMAKSQHELQRENRAIKQQLQGVQTGFTREAQSRAEQTWKTATLTAAREIEDPTARRWFITNISNTFTALAQSNRLGTVNVETLIAQELKDVRAAKTGKTRAALTRQSATVAGNAQLPKTPRPGTTHPAQGSDKGKRETLSDASKSFLSRYAR